MAFLQKMIAERIAAEKISDQEGVGFRKALRAVRKVGDEPAKHLAGATGLDASVFDDGLFSEKAIYHCCVAGGMNVPATAIVGAFGDGTFLKWLFSDEGMAQIMKWVEMIMKIIALLAPLFL